MTMETCRFVRFPEPVCSILRHGLPGGIGPSGALKTGSSGVGRQFLYGRTSGRGDRGFPGGIGWLERKEGRAGAIDDGASTVGAKGAGGICGGSPLGAIARNEKEDIRQKGAK